VSHSKTYQAVEDNARWIKDQDKATVYPLQIDQYQARKKSDDDKNKAFKEIYEHDIEDIKVSSLLADSPAIEADASRKESTQAWHKQLRKDFYLEEAMFVIRDMTK
jgi:carboxyl-terminal processing protease